jgi:TrmH family RNA methyltransferase
MLSKAKIKFIKSLQLKKYRKQEQCFVVQGAKSVLELMASDFEVQLVLGTDDFLDNAKIDATTEIIAVSEKDLSALSEFQTNDAALAVARIKENKLPFFSPNEFALVLDDIRDPGNLGTMIRTADWFGITKIIASEETADFYNPKVISATMGSFVRVDVFYTDLQEYLSVAKSVVYGAYLNGRDVHTESFDKGGLIVIGNESRGISQDLEKYITRKITIPQYGQAESLNAAIATAIICDNVRRPKSKEGTQ